MGGREDSTISVQSTEPSPQYRASGGLPAPNHNSRRQRRRLGQIWRSRGSARSTDEPSRSFAEDDAEIIAEMMTRLAEEELALLAHKARSRADPRGILQSLEESDRELRLRGIDDRPKVEKGNIKGNTAARPLTKDRRRIRGKNRSRARTRTQKSAPEALGSQTGSDRKDAPQRSKFGGLPSIHPPEIQRRVLQARFLASVPSPPRRNFGPVCPDRFCYLTFLSKFWDYWCLHRNNPLFGDLDIELRPSR